MSLLDLLRDHGVALALTDHPWMPPIQELMRQHETVGALVEVLVLGAGAVVRSRSGQTSD